MTKLHIGWRCMRLFSGKLEDRATGATPVNDIYMRMHEAGATDTTECKIDVDEGDLLELLDEIDFAINPDYGRDHYLYPENRDARLDLAAARRLYKRCGKLLQEMSGRAPQKPQLRIVD